MPPGIPLIPGYFLFIKEPGLARGDCNVSLPGRKGFCLTIVFALLTYSIADGIGLGLIFYIVMMLFAGKAKEIRIPIYIIGGFFLLSYLLSSLLKILVS